MKKSEIPARIVGAAMELIGERGWLGLSLAEVAARANVPLADLVTHYPSKGDILAAWVDEIDRQMLAGDAPDPAESARDRLFDVLMRRFDALTPYRPAVANLAAELGSDPWTALCGAQRACRSMALALEAAGISASGLSGMAKVQGLGALHLSVLRSWLRDDSADLSQTMAALDKALRRAEWLAGLLWRPPAPPPPSTAVDGLAPPP